MHKPAISIPIINKVENPMKFQYFITDDGLSSFLVGRTPSFYTRYSSGEGNLKILGCVTSFGDNFSAYIVDELCED